MAETYKSVTELMKTARGNKAIGQCLCDIVDFQEIIDDTPNADVVPVVRCKDCKWFNSGGCAIFIVDESDKPTENDYCSFAERKDDK